MKRNLLKILPILFMTLACDPEPVLLEPSQVIADANHAGIYVLSEGLFNQNNSTLSWIDFGTGLPDSWDNGTGNSYDCFEKVNGRRIGDTANDLLLYGSKLYIAVSESSTIEILDASTSRSLKQIPMSLEGKASQPRRLTASGGYVYVCCFDGTVTRIDTLTMEANATINVGRNPDGICCAKGKLYVSNSGGLDPQNPDSTVSVIDIASFQEIKRVTVRSNPGSIYAYGNSVYVVSRGIFDYGTMDYDSRLHCIDTATDQVTHTYDIPILNMDIASGMAWFYGYGSGGTIQVLDLASGMIIDSDFITDGTLIECPYSIKVEPSTRKVYVCDALDYVTPGALLCFSPEGRLLYRVQGIGINPNTVSFCDEKVTLTKYQGEPVIIGDIDRVFEYRPAPGQFVNLLPKYEPGDDAQSMAAKCLNALQSGGLITLGGFGVPDLNKMAAINPPYVPEELRGTWTPYMRDPETGSRYWAVPGREGFEHILGGLEKDNRTGAISTNPENHDLMTRLRAEKVARIPVPDLEVEGDVDDADLLIVGFGSTYGHLHAAMDELRATGHKVALAQFKYLNPLPANTAEVLKRYPKVVVAEQNMGQLAAYLRMKVDGFVPYQFNQVKGQPFVVEELVNAFEDILKK